MDGHGLSGYAEGPEGRMVARAYAGSTMSKPVPSPGQSRMWEELRKEARKLEGEIDIKLAAFSKTGAVLESDSLMSSDQMISTKAAELEGLLQRLSDVNDAMSGTVTGGDSRSHTLARHRDILQEFSQEFRRTRQIVQGVHDREALLGVRHGEDASFIGVQVAPSNGQALLRERSAISSSTAAADEVISQAQAVMGNLGSQRQLFGDIGTKLSVVSSKFPLVNGLLNAIRRKKSKDTMILSAVIAGCTLFIIIYWLSK